MTIGRTADLEVYVGNATTVHKLAHFLGGSITGSAEITTAAYNATGVEDANVHSAGASLNLTSMYDSANVSTFIMDLMGTSYATDADAYLVALEADGDLEHFEAWPVDFARPGRAAPAADAITRPWDFVGRDRGAYGFEVVPFTTDPGGSAVQLLGAADNRGANPVAVIITTMVTSGATNYELSDGSTDHNLAESPGIVFVDLAAGQQALTIDSDTQAITGVACVGDYMPLPAG